MGWGSVVLLPQGCCSPDGFMSERQHPVAECWWHCGKGWHRYLICIIIFAQGREFFWTPHYHLSWDFFNYYYYNYYYYYFRSEEEEDRNPGFAGRVFPSTHVVFISLAFVFGCSPFPCPHLPAAKPRTPPGAALLPPPPPQHFSPLPTWLSSVLQALLGGLAITSLASRQKKKRTTQA